MASGFDFSELKKFRDKLEKVSEQSQLDKFWTDVITIQVYDYFSLNSNLMI